MWELTVELYCEHPVYGKTIKERYRYGSELDCLHHFLDKRVVGLAYHSLTMKKYDSNEHDVTGYFERHYNLR